MNDVEKVEPALTAAQERFLEAFSRTGRLSSAAREAGVSVASHYKWRRDPLYARWFAAARGVAGDVVEEAAIDRAINGSEDVVIHQGRPVEVWTSKETGEIVPDTVVMAERESGIDPLNKYNVRILTRREYHDTLHALVLKGLKPEVYRDRVDVNMDIATTLEIVVRPSNE